MTENKSWEVFVANIWQKAAFEEMKKLAAANLKIAELEEKVEMYMTKIKKCPICGAQTYTQEVK